MSIAPIELDSSKKADMFCLLQATVYNREFLFDMALILVFQGICDSHSLAALAQTRTSHADSE